MTRLARFSRTPVAATLPIAALLAVTIGYLSFDNARKRTRANAQAEISRNILNAGNELLSTLQDAETGQRGFLLTRRVEYLAPYQRSRARIAQVLGRLQDATTQRPDQAKRVAALRPVVEAKLQELDETIRLEREGNRDGALRVVQSDHGKASMDAVRDSLGTITQVAAVRVQQYSAAAEASAARLRAVSTGGGIILFGFLSLSAFTVFREVSRREKLFWEAATNAAILNFTLSSIGDAVLATDKNLRITFINRVACDLSAWRESDALGMPAEQVFRIVNEVTREKVVSPLETALATATVVGLANHTILLARDGREIPIDDSAAPIRGEDGAIVGAVMVFRDVAAQREADRVLRESNQQLQEFVAAAAHDLRSPIASMTRVSELLSARYSSRLDGDGKELLSYIVRAGSRAVRLVEDLLAYARASHFEHQPGVSSSLAAALSAACENLQAEIATAGAEIAAGELPRIPVEETHLVMLLQNLVGNAIKYRSADPPRVTVGAIQRDHDALVHVSDNGIGIDPQYVPLIFKPFKRLHGEELPGSGIGLAACQKIVAGYNGRLWCESKAGVGSTFYFTIPAPPDGASGDPVEPAAAPA
ncbi:MAG: domain S-box-containing protein [Bryobacterales bacterium]|nr:domain S-box-containing protein [Bryobacterales bacterium]